jgi:hypothetical protein
MIAQPGTNGWSELLTWSLAAGIIEFFRPAKRAILIRIVRCGMTLSVSDARQLGSFKNHGFASTLTEQVPNGTENRKGDSMEPVLRPSRNRLLRLFAPIAGWSAKIWAALAPQSNQGQSQRMCPFCGLITPRYKTSCLECGKYLNPA